MPSVNLLFGPMLIGTYLNAILYGVMVLQMFIYYQHYKKDGAVLRSFVLYLFVVETVNTCTLMAMMYEPLVTRFGTPYATTFFPLLLPADPIMTVLISTPIQIFLAWRIRIISRTVWFALIICILAIAAMGGGIWLGVTVINIRQYSRKPELHWPALLWLIASAIADITLTGSLTYYLARRKSGFTATDDTINKIIRLTVQTGLITTLFAILDVICFLALPHTTVNFVWDFALSKLYTNALISTLNARSSWGNLIENNSTYSASEVISRIPDLHGRGHLQTVSTGIYELGSTQSHHHTSKFGDAEYGIKHKMDVGQIAPMYH